MNSLPRLTVAVLCLAPTLAAVAEEWPDPPPAVVDYTMQVRLDPALRTLHGKTRLVWRNRTDVAAGELAFHLYLNAFRNNRSTFMVESETQHRSRTMEEGQWGWVEVHRIAVNGGDEYRDRMVFAQPDDRNEEDRSVALLPLETPVAPGASVTIHMDFTARLPHAFARTGFKGNFFMAAQWFPKLAVFQGGDGWNHHQFHANSEFFADFGNYDVTITTPAAYVVGATGRQVGEEEHHQDGTVSRRFLQDAVHDFAWTADPDSLELKRTFVGSRHGVPDLPPVEVTLLLQPEHAYQEDRIFAAAFAAIRDLGRWYGPYPYDTLTIVDPQHGARGAGGMEYPTLITIGSDWHAPAAFQRPEGVTVHEFAHQYWYGLVATNEFEESWLDEGLTTYVTQRIMADHYGPRPAHWNLGGFALRGHPLLRLPAGPAPKLSPGRPQPLRLHLPATPWGTGGETRASDWLLLHRLGLPDNSVMRAFREAPLLTYLRDMPIPQEDALRRRYLQGPQLDPVVRRAWEYSSRLSYGLNSYQRPALVLVTLERVLGAENMVRALRTYQNRYRYRHPTTRDFEATIDEVAGREMSWLLRPLLHGNGVLDYAVEQVTSKLRQPAEGIFGHGENLHLLGEGPRFPGQPARGTSASDEAEKTYSNEVLIRRRGEIAVPVAIRVDFDDGTTLTENWDGRDPWIRFQYPGTRQVTRATVDPGGLYPIDLNWANNSRAVQADRHASRHWSLRALLWMQHVLSFYAGLA